MKMTKYVHCTVVETRVGGRMTSEDVETLDGDPCPQHNNLKKAYQIQAARCVNGPSIVDFRA